jgi:phage shock protein A
MGKDLSRKVERQMDLLQDQVAVLNVKVDALHQTVEHLKSQLTEILTEVKVAAASKDGSQPQTGVSSVRYSYHSRTFEGNLEHKDVLSDFAYPEADLQNGDRRLAPEVQIQRLTAQLTAAYNRIAALEEQLLANRIH